MELTERFQCLKIKQLEKTYLKSETSKNPGMKFVISRSTVPFRPLALGRWAEADWHPESVEGSRI